MNTQITKLALIAMTLMLTACAGGGGSNAAFTPSEDDSIPAASKSELKGLNGNFLVVGQEMTITFKPISKSGKVINLDDAKYEFQLVVQCSCSLAGTYTAADMAKEDANTYSMKYTPANLNPVSITVLMIPKSGAKASSDLVANDLVTLREYEACTDAAVVAETGLRREVVSGKAWDLICSIDDLHALRTKSRSLIANLRFESDIDMNDYYAKYGNGAVLQPRYEEGGDWTMTTWGRDVGNTNPEITSGVSSDIDGNGHTITNLKIYTFGLSGMTGTLESWWNSEYAVTQNVTNLNINVTYYINANSPGSYGFQNRDLLGSSFNNDWSYVNLSNITGTVNHVYLDGTLSHTF